MICLSNIDNKHFVAVCEYCNEMFVAKDYESLCSFCRPMMDDINEQEAIAIEIALQDDESYQEYLREHAS